MPLSNQIKKHIPQSHQQKAQNDLLGCFLELHEETFGQYSQFQFNKLRH